MIELTDCLELDHYYKDYHITKYVSENFILFEKKDSLYKWKVENYDLYFFRKIGRYRVIICSKKYITVLNLFEDNRIIKLEGSFIESDTDGVYICKYFPYDKIVNAWYWSLYENALFPAKFLKGQCKLTDNNLYYNNKIIAENCLQVYISTSNKIHYEIKNDGWFIHNETVSSNLLLFESNNYQIYRTCHEKILFYDSLTSWALLPNLGYYVVDQKILGECTLSNLKHVKHKKLLIFLLWIIKQNKIKKYMPKSVLIFVLFGKIIL